MFYEAIFKPSEEENDNEEALKHVDMKIALNEGWIVQDGPFKGQQCYYVPNSRVGLIPKSDLTDLKPVAAVQWNDIHKRMGYGQGK